MTCFCQKDNRTHQEITSKITDDIIHASSLGKTARNLEGRRIAYRLKASTLSNALLNFSEYFKVVQAERNSLWGILLLIRLPNGRGAHVPLNELTSAAQDRIHSKVVELLEGLPYPDAA